ncbi:hypothetical protein AtNW77_Chr1g0065851 [Arabidopsis thaliana]
MLVNRDQIRSNRDEKKKMGSKTSTNMVALLLYLLILISLFPLKLKSSRLQVANLVTNGRPIVWTPASRSCGASHASWKKNNGPCKRPPRTAPASYNSP